MPFLSITNVFKQFLSAYFLLWETVKLNLTFAISVTQNLSNIKVENFIVLAFFPFTFQVRAKGLKVSSTKYWFKWLARGVGITPRLFYLLAVKIPRYFLLQSLVRLKRFALWLARRIALVLAWTTGVNRGFQAVSGHLSVPNDNCFDPVEQATSASYVFITLSWLPMMIQRPMPLWSGNCSRHSIENHTIV